MRNKFIAFIFTFFCIPICYAENTILIEQKDGLLAKFVFDSEAEFTYSGSSLVITSDADQVFYQLSNLKKVTFHLETSVDDTQKDYVSFFFQQNSITIENARPNASVQVFSVDGRQVGVWQTDKMGYLELDIDGLKKNVYVIVLDGLTYKFVKR